MYFTETGVNPQVTYYTYNNAHTLHAFVPIKRHEAIKEGIHILTVYIAGGIHNHVAT